VRAFIAIAVPESVLSSCEEIMVRLKGLKLQGRFAKTESIHLTLQFLGNIEEDQIAPIAQVLEQASSLDWCGTGRWPHEIAEQDPTRP